MNRLPGLDLLRALAIALVVPFHYSRGVENRLGFVGRFGWIGVDLFFVLSGYLIGKQLFLELRERGEPRLSKFYLRRAFRILPAYLAVVALYFLLPGFKDGSSLPPLWKFLTFTQNLGLDRTLTSSFSNAWSLCVEEHFYLVLPLLTWLWFRKRSFSPVAMIAVLIAAGMAYRLSVWKFLYVPAKLISERENTRIYFEWYYYPTPARLDGLLGGVSLALIEVFRPALWRKMLQKRWPAYLVAALSLGCAYGIDIGENEFLKFSLFFPILAVGFTALVALAASSASRIQVPGAAILATLAYTIYLTHKPVIALARPWWIAHGIAPQSAGLLLATLVPVIGMALAVHLLVERPLLQSREALIRRLLRRGSGALGVNSRTKRLHLAP